MSALIGTSPLGLAMIKHQNKIIAHKGLGMAAKNINGELRSTVAKQEVMIALQQKEFPATTAQHAKEIKALTATVKEQASQIQKVSVDSNVRTIWITNTHRDDGKRFVVHADEKLTAFFRLESAIRARGELI
jgi:hypothetical protein